MVAMAQETQNFKGLAVGENYAPDKIDGFLHADEARLLTRLASLMKHDAVEVGAYKGKSTVALAIGARFVDSVDLKVWSVDPHDAHTDEHHGGASFGPADNQDYHKNVAPYAERIKTINLPSVTAAAVWSKRIGVLFIDGDHTYSAVRTDFHLWSPFVVDGVVVIHDAGGSIPAVKRFVDEVLARGDWEQVDQVRTAVVLKRKGT